jgi:hypothetical protein
VSCHVVLCLEICGLGSLLNYFTTISILARLMTSRGTYSAEAVCRDLRPPTILERWGVVKHSFDVQVLKVAEDVSSSRTKNCRKRTADITSANGSKLGTRLNLLYASISESCSLYVALWVQIRNVVMCYCL